jgi:hypothetical protein
MGNGQVGGNGSVHWMVDADEVKAGNESYMLNRRKTAGRDEWQQRGSDFRGNSGGSGQDFTIRIKLPDNSQAWLASVRTAVDNAQALGRLEFTLPIEKPSTPHTQVQIAWGADPGWRDDLPTPSGV